MAGSKLRIRGDIQIQLAKVGYELRRLQKELEDLAVDRPPKDVEKKLLTNIEAALKGLRSAEDHAELVGFYLDALEEPNGVDETEDPDCTEEL